jgi:Flp pilus assembly protein TadG
VGRAGQSTVEFALVLPLVITVLLLVVQVVVVVRARLLLEQALHEAARVAALRPDADAAQRAAARALPGATATLGPRRDTVRVEVRYRCATDVVLVGPLLPDVVLRTAVVVGRAP